MKNWHIWRLAPNGRADAWISQYAVGHTPEDALSSRAAVLNAGEVYLVACRDVIAGRHAAAVLRWAPPVIQQCEPKPVVIV